ncbi:hypothetical protein [Ideonella sp.]|uniref:hypothetical protein n=1 Tax=Ideonella sp. TaxID=1929293 RepID=UPI0037C05D05
MTALVRTATAEPRDHVRRVIATTAALWWPRPVSLPQPRQPAANAPQLHPDAVLHFGR